MKDHCKSSERPLGDLQRFLNDPRGSDDSSVSHSYSQEFILGYLVASVSGLEVRDHENMLGTCSEQSTSRFGR